jgi:hypothetical protein
MGLAAAARHRASIPAGGRDPGNEASPVSRTGGPDDPFAEDPFDD